MFGTQSTHVKKASGCHSQQRSQGLTPEHRQQAKSEQRLVERAKIIFKCLNGKPPEILPSNQGYCQQMEKQLFERWLPWGCSICLDAVKLLVIQSKTNKESLIE